MNFHEYISFIQFYKLHTHTHNRAGYDNVICIIQKKGKTTHELNVWKLSASCIEFVSLAIQWMFAHSQRKSPMQRFTACKRFHFVIAGNIVIVDTDCHHTSNSKPLYCSSICVHTSQTSFPFSFTPFSCSFSSCMRWVYFYHFCFFLEICIFMPICICS